MHELVRESLRGTTGKAIDKTLLSLIEKLDKVSISQIRDGQKSYADVRYHVGISDGIRLALNAIHEMAGTGQ